MKSASQVYKNFMHAEMNEKIALKVIIISGKKFEKKN